jgi:hypothetical protein
MIDIYSNNILTDHYIGQLKFGQSYQIYHSIEQYLAADAKIKIAFVNHLNMYDTVLLKKLRRYSVTNDNGAAFSYEIGQLKTLSDLVVAFDNEIHPYHYDIFQQHQQPNVCWAVPGYINDPQLIDPTNTILWIHHVVNMVDPYRETLLHKLKELDHTTPKSMYFDALLGQPRAHRDFVYDSIQSQNLQKQILTTYQNQGGSLFINNFFKTNFEWEPDIEHFDSTVTRSTDSVQYQGCQIALSKILPIQVYNRTAYSIVTETGRYNQYSFFTEKTTKPMMARRLFVMFSGYKFLQNLQNLGFQTFGNVIDESYDLMYNDNDRWSAAFEQVQRLCKMDQLEVFAKIAPAVEHNYSLLMNTDWEQHLLDQLQQKLNQFMDLQMTQSSLIRSSEKNRCVCGESFRI